MEILVNFSIKKGEVVLNDYKFDGEKVILYDLKHIAIMSSDLDTSSGITIMYDDSYPFPIIISKDMAEYIKNNSVKVEDKKEKQVQVNENTIIEFGEEMKEGE